MFVHGLSFVTPVSYILHTGNTRQTKCVTSRDIILEGFIAKYRLISAQDDVFISSVNVILLFYEEEDVLY